MIEHKHLNHLSKESIFEKSKKYIKKHKAIVGGVILLICILIYRYWNNIKSYWNEFRGIKEDKKEISIKKKKDDKYKKHKEDKKHKEKSIKNMKKAKEKQYEEHKEHEKLVKREEHNTQYDKLMEKILENQNILQISD